MARRNSGFKNYLSSAALGLSLIPAACGKEQDPYMGLAINASRIHSTELLNWGMMGSPHHPANFALTGTSHATLVREAEERGQALCDFTRQEMADATTLIGLRCQKPTCDADLQIEGAVGSVRRRFEELCQVSRSEKSNFVCICER